MYACPCALFGLGVDTLLQSILASLSAKSIFGLRSWKSVFASRSWKSVFASRSWKSVFASLSLLQEHVTSTSCKDYGLKTVLPRPGGKGSNPSSGIHARFAKSILEICLCLSVLEICLCLSVFAPEPFSKQELQRLWTKDGVAKTRGQRLRIQASNLTKNKICIEYESLPKSQISSKKDYARKGNTGAERVATGSATGRARQSAATPSSPSHLPRASMCVTQKSTKRATSCEVFLYSL